MAEDAALRRKLWPENFDASKPALVRLDLSRPMKESLDSGVPLSCVKSGDSGGRSMYSNRLLSAVMAHVRAPGALVIVIATPFLNGSVFEAGMVRTMWDGAMMDGTNCTLLLVRWVLRSKFLPECVVNSPHLRNPENAVVVAASKLSWPLRFEWLADVSMRVSMSRVIGSLGDLSRSPMYLLMPQMSRWSIGDSHAENCRPTSMWADRRCVI